MHVGTAPMVVKKKIAIIGSGISGLSLAHYLTKLGKGKGVSIACTLIDKAPRSGGWLHTCYMQDEENKKSATISSNGHRSGKAPQHNACNEDIRTHREANDTSMSHSNSTNSSTHSTKDTSYNNNNNNNNDNNKSNNENATPTMTTTATVAAADKASASARTGARELEGNEYSTRTSFLFERGPRSLMTRRGDDALEMIEDLGLADQVIFADRAAGKRYLWDRAQGKLHLLPTGFNGTLVGCPPIRPLPRALLREPFVPASEAEDESVYDFIARRLSPAVADNLIDPMVRACGVRTESLRRVTVCFMCVSCE